MIFTFRNSGILLSCVLLFLIPVALGIYWPLFTLNPNLIGILLRPLMLAFAFMLALVWIRIPQSKYERRLVFVYFILIGALLIPSLLAKNVPHAMGEWVKLILISSFSYCIARALRNEKAARSFGYGMVVCACILGFTLAYFYGKMMGIRVPSYEALRDYKEYARRAGLMINTVTFSCIFSYLCACCLLPYSRWLRMIGIVLLILCAFFTGSRTPLLIVTATAVLLMVLNVFHQGTLLKKMLVSMVIVLGLMALTRTLLTVSNRQIRLKMSEVTEGRWDLWYAAETKFIERPIAGWGYDSWSDDLDSRLPGDYKLTHSLEKQITSGAYHNEFITALAEQGIVGTSAILLLYIFLLHCSWQLAIGKVLSWKNAQWAIFAALFMTLRANIEVPGLFGYAQEPADYLAYAFMALVISRFSVDEDWLRQSATVARSNGFTQQKHFFREEAALGG